MRYYEQLQHIVNAYISAGGKWPATTKEIAGWGIQKGLWKPRGSDLIDVFADQLARAMREEYLIDPQGRHIRSKHAIRTKQGGTQTALWADIRTASRQHMEIAFKQRRQQIVGDCKQLKLDVDSYNENENSGKPIQMVFDFTHDLIEAELASSHPIS